MWDDWDLFVPHFHNLATGDLHWSDINAQHNEYIVAVPLLVSLASAKLTGGRLLAVTYLSYAFLCGSFGLLFLLFRMLRLPGAWSDLWFLPAGVLFLGWRQADSLLWSTHVVNTMTLFFILATLYCCTKFSSAPVWFGAAILFAWLASFSMASGLLVWFPGGLALAASTGLRFDQRARATAWWLVMGVACWLCFFLDVAPHPVPWPTGLSFVLSHPLEGAQYALVYVGGSLGATSLQALYLGFVFACLALLVLVLAVRYRGTTQETLPGLLIFGYVAMVIPPLLSSRLGLGVGQAFSNRYVTVSAVAPIGIYLGSLALASSIPTCRYLRLAMLLLLAFGVFNSYRTGLVDGRLENLKRTACAAAVKNFRNVDRSSLACGYPDPGVVLERAPWLERYHQSLFAY